MRRLYRFLFKIPQRKWIGMRSLWIDLKGYLSIFLRQLFSQNKLKQNSVIWICVPVYNRWEMFFEHLLPSLLQLKNKHRVALSIFDSGSENYELQMEKLNRLWADDLVLDREPIPFSRASLTNRAVKQCNGEYLFICDTDMSLPTDFVNQYFKYVTPVTAWFPICQWQLNEESKSWRWFTEGCGMAGLTRTQYVKTGGLNESYKEWGKEDWDLFFEMYEKNIASVRNRQMGLYHHWHISGKPANFKSMF